jgi:hypothetical protein
MENDRKIIDDPFEFLEQMSKIGKMTKTITVVENFKVTLSTLDSDDEGTILANTDDTKGTEFFSRYKQETLSFAIKAINDKPLNFYETIEDEKERKTKKEECIEKIKTILKKWNDDLLSFVYNEYIQMLEENEQRLVKLGIIKENEKNLKIITEDTEELKKESEEEKAEVKPEEKTEEETKQEEKQLPEENVEEK